MTFDAAPAIIPIITAVIGLAAGLTAPMVNAALGRRAQSRSDEQGRCDRVLAMFEEGDVADRLLAPDGQVRRMLYLTAMCIKDDPAREACKELATYVASADGADVAVRHEVVSRWATMVQEVSRARRLTG